MDMDNDIEEAFLLGNFQESFERSKYELMIENTNNGKVPSETKSLKINAVAHPNNKRDDFLISIYLQSIYELNIPTELEQAKTILYNKSYISIDSAIIWFRLLIAMKKVKEAKYIAKQIINCLQKEINISEKNLLFNTDFHDSYKEFIKNYPDYVDPKIDSLGYSCLEKSKRIIHESCTWNIPIPGITIICAVILTAVTAHILYKPIAHRILHTKKIFSNKSQVIKKCATGIKS